MRAAAVVPAVAAAAAAGAVPDVYYYTRHGYDASESVAAVTGATATLRKWDTPMRVFDSAKDVVAARVDVAGAPGASAALYADGLPLSGAAYIFAENVSYTLTDKSSGGKARAVAATDAVVWLSAGSCVGVDVTLNSTGGASLLFVSSGAIDWAPSAGASCSALTSLVGEEMQVNYVKYALTNNASCTSPLEHGDDYSNLDEPIRSLPAHYHTRGALYYLLYGSGQFNDNSSKTYAGQKLYGGELRFVNDGVYYGPEVLDQPPLSYVSSVHEVDPSAVVPADDAALFPPGGKDQCPFACMQVAGSAGPARCVKKSGL